MKKRLILFGIIAIVVASLFVFTACGAEDLIPSLGKLATPTGFSYDGKFITWNRVDNATSYLVVLNGGTELEYNTTSCRYENTSGEDFRISVKAKADGYDASDIAEVVFSPIGEVTNVTIEDDGTLLWTEVEYADSYEITVNNDKTTVTQSRYSDLPAGQSQVSIRAKRASEQGIVFYSTGKWTKTITICEDVAIKNITYKDGTIAWAGVSGAHHYELYINGQLESDEVNGTRYDFDAHNGNFEVGIRAIGNHSTTFDSKTVVKKNFIYLEAATDLHIDSGVLYWAAVENAESYTLKVNGTELRQSFTECRYDGLRAGQETRIQIKANSTDTAYYASWTDEKSFLLLAAPEIRWVDGNLDGTVADTIVWDAVLNANGYCVHITAPDKSTNEVNLPSETRAYGNAYLDSGEYIVSVKSLADKTSANVCDSAYSQEIKVIRLAAPKAANSDFIKSYPDNVSTGFDVTFSSVANASGYELWRDDTRVNSTDANRTQFARVNDFVDEAVMTEQIYTYRIKSIGSSYNSSRRVKVLDSLSSSTLNFDITVLAMPSNPTMEGFNISYGSVNKASKYTIDIGGSLKDSETTSYSLANIPSGTYDVRVNARGNMSNILSSNYTVPINVIRLRAPENIRITTEGSEGILLFDGSYDALSYDLVINGQVKNIASSNVENIAKEITTSGTQMHMRAVRNEYDLNRTHYYMTSPDSQTKTFTKLLAPTFGTSAFSNTQLIWNAVTNFTDYSPTYKVYDDSDIAYNGTINGATMDISYLGGGKSYNFKVKAIGDGVKYINSDLSEQRSIYKLATPNVSVNNTKDAYTWRSVSNTESYAVYVDGTISNLEIHNYGDDYTFKPKFTAVKTYQVAFYAKGDGGIETIDSDPFVIAQETRQLDLPDFSFNYTGANAAHVVTDYIVMTITQPSAYSTAYVYNIGGVSSNETTATTYQTHPNNVGSYALSVYAVGGGFDEDGIYYTDSQVRGGNSNYTLTLLAQPNANDISINRDGILSWRTVSSASAYGVTLTINGDGYDEIIVNQGNTFDIAAMLASVSKTWGSVTNVTVSIVSKGNGTSVIDSVATEKVFSNISH